MGISEAVDAASKQFLNDYRIPASETYMIPVDVNGKRTNPILLEQKLEAVLLHIETTDYIDKFMGEDGYMHFAKFAGIENLTEEQVRNRVLSTIKNNSIILNNKDLTGAIVYSDFANGKYPIVNAKGDKIEIYFTPTENNKGIMSTELKYPVTGEDIQLVDEDDGLSYLDFPIDENQNIGAESMTVGSAIDTVGSLFVSKAEASEISPSIDKSFEGYIKNVENDKLLDGSFKNFRHKSKEGGLDTIGFGHKLTKEESKNNKVYQYDLSEINSSTSPERILEISNDILKQDLEKTEKILITTYGNEFINLDSRRKQMLIDMQFNVRNFKEKNVFPNFKKALFAGDEEGMKKEYKRVFTDKNGKVKPLARNEFFRKYFLDK